MGVTCVTGRGACRRPIPSFGEPTNIEKSLQNDETQQNCILVFWGNFVLRRIEVLPHRGVGKGEGSGGWGP